MTTTDNSLQSGFKAFSKRFFDDTCTTVCLDVPAPYKIVSGGVQLNGQAELLASAPETLTTWRVQLHALHASHVDVTIHVVAACDPSNLLDVEIVSTESTHSATALVSSNGILTGGGALGSGAPLLASRPMSGSWSAAVNDVHSSVTAVGVSVRRRDGGTIECSLDHGIFSANFGEPFGDMHYRFGTSVGQLETVLLHGRFEDAPSSIPRHAHPAVWQRHRMVLQPDRLAALKKEFCARPKSPAISQRSNR
jgi:hypothetical protein